MAARFAGDAEIGAGATPFETVRRKTAAPGACLGEKMSQLVTQGAIDLRFTVSAKANVKQNPGVRSFRATGRAPQSS